VEAEREENIEALKSFVPSVEVALGHREGVSEVEEAVHVGIRESLEPLGLRVRLYGPVLITFPNASCTMLHRDEFVTTSGVLHGLIE